MTKQRDHPSIILGVQVFNPSHGLGVGDLSEVTLGGRMLRGKALYEFLIYEKGCRGPQTNHFVRSYGGNSESKLSRSRGRVYIARWPSAERGHCGSGLSQ